MNQREKDVELANKRGFENHGRSRESTAFADGAAYGRKDLVERVRKAWSDHDDYKMPMWLIEALKVPK